MAEKIKYRLWLKLRVGKPLATEERALKALVAGRTVTIESDRQAEPLSKASWLVMGCRGFETESHARKFGEKLRRAAHLAGLCARVGVDAGDPGEDLTVSWVNPKTLCSGGGLDPDTRIGPDVHGIVILPDDGKTIFVRVGPARAQVLSNAGDFVQALEQALPENDVAGSDLPSIRRAIRMLNLAQMNTDPIGKVVLAISAIEGLATDPPWTDEQQNLIESSAAWLEQAHGCGEETKQVIDAILQVRKESIRQRIKKSLAANELSGVWEDWETLYSKRSRLFHGRTNAESEHRGDYLEQSELHGLAQKAINLCSRIVLSMAKQEGISVPDRAKVHFGVK